RDLKAANVFLARSPMDARETIKILDFGIAKVAADIEQLTKTGMIMGSVESISPEQIASAGRVDARADVYSMGAVLFHMLTGVPPVSGSSVFEVISRIV